MPLTKVTSGAITDSAITTAKIEDGTIVNADINASANISQSKLSLSLPTISSITIQDSQGAIPPSDTSLYFDIIGTNFSNPSTVELLDSSTNVSTNSTTVTYVSATQLRVTASLSAGTYKIRVTRSDGFAGTSSTALLTVSQAVSWSTSAGSLGTFDESLAISTITLSATSNSSVTYAVQSGSLPTGLSLNTSNGEITGTPSAVSADTTSTFTVRATDAESQYADREFTITVTNIVIAQSLRFNDDDGAYLSRTLSASPTNQKIVSFSFWAKRGNLGVYSYNLVGNTSAPYVIIGFLNDDTFSFQLDAGSGSTGLITTAKYRDTSAWYHILGVLDTTQATSSNRLKIYVNGIQVTDFGTANYPAQDSTWNINTNVEHGIGGSSAIQDFDGYMAEVHFIDGQALTPSSFGETGSNGRWKPKTYSGTYGTNGFYLDFADSSAFGDDESGNTNDFTATNLAATDQVKDTPQNNFATLNPLVAVSPIPSLSEGNLQSTPTGNGNHTTGATIFMPENSGKWYAETVLTYVNNQSGAFTIQDPNNIKDSIATYSGQYSVLWQASGTDYYATHDGSSATNSTNATISVGDIFQIAYDSDNGKVWFGRNNTWITGNPSTDTSPTYSGITGDKVFTTTGYRVTSGSSYTAQLVNFGQDSSFAGNKTAQNNSDGNGFGDFYYAPPSGYKALCTNNLPEPTIKDSSAYFHTQLYTGNGTDDRSITNDANAGDFSPDFLWVKNRTSANGHALVDTTRGATKVLRSQTNNVEETEANGIQAFETDGFQIGTSGLVNTSGNNYVAWQWKANGGTTSSNTDGSITSTVQANTTAGFSIVTYTGTGTAGTIGHGLGKKPQCIILKNRSFNDSWITFHEPEGATKFMSLDTTGASDDFGAMWNDTEPTTSVFGIGSDSGGRWVNSSGDTYVAYCFAGIEGYSKFGKYTGNGSADGTFIYTGFKPAMIIIKRTDSAGENWTMFDNKRDGYNVNNDMLKANVSETEDAAGNFFDLLSNGFKARETAARHNASGGTYIYMAFAESPFGGILTNEATAR